ncbi:effector-associated constant component EACC1 [Saccharothrix xinjiangensis]|uniref:Uncharacterized protein n=1 Tax=Saccharothrix xinjiangensis TaxID=204798 RepID=A0ABV9XVG4_9PSEU
MTPVLELELRLVAADGRRSGAVRSRRELQDALLDAGAAKVDEVDVDHPPPGRRAGELEIVGLLVSSTGTLAAVVQVLQGWKRKKAHTAEPDTALTLTIGGVTVNISDVPTPEELNEIRALLERFDGEGEPDGS